MIHPISAFEGWGVPAPRLLLVAATGGHLTQLVRFAQAAGLSDRATWVTFDSPQSRSLLNGQKVVWVEYVAPRDFRGVMRARNVLQRQLDPSEFDGVVSTGAAVALSGFLWAWQNGIPRRYIESVSRTDGPSLTGRITRAFRLATTYTQHADWASPQWQLTHSVMSGFSNQRRNTIPQPGAPLKVFVTLGTIRPYRFDRLVDQVLQVTRPEDTIIWQVGSTAREDLPGEVCESMSMESLLEVAGSADAVITHAGVGTIMQLCEAGISPVVVPRLSAHGEHVDDHQLQIWNLLVKEQVAQPIHSESLTRDVLVEAASHRTVVKAEM